MHSCMHIPPLPPHAPTPTYQEYQQEQAEPQARSAHHHFSGSVKPGWQQWQKSTHSASTCCQHSQSALKQSNASVVSTLDQHWNSATLLLSALWMKQSNASVVSTLGQLWNSATLLLLVFSVNSETVQHFCCQHSRSAMSYETVQHFCCQHSWSALKQCNTSVVSTLDQLWNSATLLLSALSISSETVQHFCCQHS